MPTEMTRDEIDDLLATALVHTLTGRTQGEW